MDITTTHLALIKFTNEGVVPFCGLTQETFQEFNFTRLQKLGELFLKQKTDSNMPYLTDNETGAVITRWVSEEDANNWISFVNETAKIYNVSVQISRVKPA